MSNATKMAEIIMQGAANGQFSLDELLASLTAKPRAAKAQPAHVTIVPEAKVKRQRRSKAEIAAEKAEKASYAHAMTAAAVDDGKSTRQRKAAKYTYGTSAVCKTPNGVAAVFATMEARVAQLEAAVPGIMAEAVEVFHTGVIHGTGGKKMKTRSNPNLWLDNPWTYVAIKKGQAIGTLDAEQVKAGLASCGYRWSPANAMYATTTTGRPCGNMGKNYRAEQIGRRELASMKND